MILTTKKKTNGDYDNKETNKQIEIVTTRKQKQTNCDNSPLPPLWHQQAKLPVCLPGGIRNWSDFHHCYENNQYR